MSFGESVNDGRAYTPAVRHLRLARCWFWPVGTVFSVLLRSTGNFSQIQNRRVWLIFRQVLRAVWRVQPSSIQKFLIERESKMKKAVLALLLCASGAALANSACDTPKDDFDGLYCLNKVYQEADKELNANYKKLHAQLDSDGKKMLKSSQLSWIANRNSSCSKRESTGFYVNLDCATSTTIQRSQFLQDRIRECASAGCQNSKL